jgi:hypothetical protein
MVAATYTFCFNKSFHLGVTGLIMEWTFSISTLVSILRKLMCFLSFWNYEEINSNFVYLIAFGFCVDFDVGKMNV